jgi:hypothetical protein
MLRWWIAEAGLFLTVFAIVALSGPGRIDIVDGQTRYEVARSLVDHGDLIIRDPNVWFVVFPGRNGQLYTRYRFPQSVIGVGAILAADGTGNISEPRRHFFFALTGAVGCAILAVTYAGLFRCLGYREGVALLWAMGGIFCTPSWFYGTSTFDDILGSAAVVVAVGIALIYQDRQSRAGAIMAGLALGLAFNCKEPLGIFVLPVLAAVYNPHLTKHSLLSRLLIVGGLLALGVAVYKGYDLYKFPPGSTGSHAEIMKRYSPVWSRTPENALLAMLFSSSTGILFYNPPIVLSLFGLAGWWNRERLFCQLLTVAIVVFILFISLLTFFKGDPTWGPRYLTPIFAVLWIMVPSGSRRLRWWIVTGVLGLGLIIQLGALSIDPHRLYIEKGLPSSFYLSDPRLYFDPAISHIINRPREIAEVIESQSYRAACFSPSPAPTFAFPVIDLVAKGPAAIRKYHILNSFRFWWVSFQYLEPSLRPIDIQRGVTLLTLVLLMGLLLQVFGVCALRS